MFDPHSKTSRKLSVRLAFSADFGDPYMVLAGGRVWMLTSNEGLSVKGLVAVDPTSGKVVRRVTMPDGLGPYFAVVNGAVWAAQPDEDRVVRIPLS